MASIFFSLIVANAAAWIWASLILTAHPALWSLAALAYVFGLRHAFDADHIAAIDNVVRKLLQQGEGASSVGLFFSLGHSTIVVLACVVIATATASLQHRLQGLHDIGGVVGTAVPASFLLLIGIANIFVLRSVWLAFKAIQRGQRPISDALAEFLGGGPLARLYRPLFRLVSRPWHMYPIGVLFGLGFDTATEVGLLSLSAQSSSRGLSLLAVLIFPTLFTAAMSLLDTTDSLLMMRAYGWAFIHPLRKLWYNLTITAASVLVALGIGSLEALGLMAERLQWKHGVWRIVVELSDDLSRLGYVVVGIFIVSWMLSVAVYRLMRFEALAAE